MKKESSMPSFVKMEENVLQLWKEGNQLKKIMKKNEGSKDYFAFLDGPITANNEMKMHHVWNRALKDIMLRFNAMQGKDAHFQGGFDAQGLWVEVEVEKDLGLKDKTDILKFGMDKFTEACIERVNHFAGKITEQSIRLGQIFDFENSYYTNSNENITSIWHFLKVCHSKNWLIQKLRPMPWCSHCGTSLSEHELAESYLDMESDAVFFHLPIKNSQNDILVWTTTPWTLSANVAVAVNPNLDYCICKVKSLDRNLIVGADAIKVLKNDLVRIVSTVKGSELVGLSYTTCFPELEEQNFEHKIVAWDLVEATSGSGAVHIAPGCGAEDFELGESLNLPQVSPVDESGIFYDNFGFLKGKNTDEAAQIIFDRLKLDGKMYYSHKFMHRYPICWRCKHPLIFRLTKEWYLKADEIRPQLIAQVDNVEWQPEFLKKRMLDWLNNMGDWNISRKRFYGLPLPFYPCRECGHLTVVGSFDELINLSDKEQVEKLPHLHRPYIDEIKIKCLNCGALAERVADVGDCWLDAGIAPFSTKKYFTDKEFFNKNFPIDCVIEMKEQIRLWFYSMLFMSVTLTGKAPYKKVIGFASLVAEDGSKFSKSGPKNISFNDAVQKYGADVLRYLFSANNMQNDTRFGFSLCDEVKRKLLGFWNAYVFFNTYAILDKPDLSDFVPDYKTMDKTDLWLIEKTNEFIINSKQNYSHEQFFLVSRDFEQYVDDLTNWYIRVNRRRFWKSTDETDKLNAYFALYYALKNAVKIMTPIIPFMCEHIWQNMVRKIEPNEAEFIMLSGYPEVSRDVNSKHLIVQTENVRNIINLVSRLRAENQIKVKQPLKTLFVVADEQVRESIENFDEIIKDELNIKEIKMEFDSSRFNDEYLTINFKNAGRVLKGDVQKVKETLANLSEIQMQDAVGAYKSGLVKLLNYELTQEMFELNTKPKKDYVIANENGVTVVLDITIDENLMKEGLYRELVRQAQVIRKEAGFNVEDRIVLEFVTQSELLNEIIKEFNAKINSELLVKTSSGLKNFEVEKEVEVGDEKVTIKMKR